jgi:hypothetical protein
MTTTASNPPVGLCKGSELPRTQNKPIPMKFKIHQSALALSSLGLACFLTSCARVQTSEYAEWVEPLDPKNELTVSTFPAWYPDSERVVPGFKKLTTDRYLALQFHVREKGRKFGQSPYVESIKIHSFAYHLDDSPEKVLVENQSKDSWMQQIDGYRDREKSGIPYREDSVLHVTMDMTLNGTRHRLKGSMPARTRQSLMPNLADSP